MITGTTTSAIDQAEVDKFAGLSDRWWDLKGPYAPLHRINPLRVRYIRDVLAAEFSRDAGSIRSLDGLTVLDVGCGGGLLAEPLARLGARVTGVEPAPESIAVAGVHAIASGLEIDYRAVPAETLRAEGRRFDAVIASEVIEHVPDQAGFLAVLAGLARPGGVVLVSTLNRTLRSYALAIFAAENLLRWVPRGTHDWNRFVTPDELMGFATATGLTQLDRTGVVFDPIRRDWRLSADTAVNYWAAFRA
jgi:2-polyprenyl-6-hydroxyphenyl methylase / 3-demethylubiquinone-9 3-methyltransferase